MKFSIYLLSFACLVFLGLWLDACGRLKDSELTAQAVRSVWEADKLIADQQNAARDAFELDQDSVRRVDSLRHGKEIGRLTGDLKASKRRERSLRPDTITVSLTDTIYLKYDTLVAELKNERDSLRISFETSIDSLKATVETQKGQIQLCDSLMNEIKIPAKPSLLSFGGSIGPGLVIGPDGLVHGGVGATVGLNIKIPLKLRMRDLFRRKR